MAFLVLADRTLVPGAADRADHYDIDAGAAATVAAAMMQSAGQRQPEFSAMLPCGNFYICYTAQR